ncbi:DUF6221 family protein [Streptomyces adelaidensis]|uniref:DUF6221 family protein n=1 Tax=Streptomyces adelaidensis TaxID=2796465 RepID=UPI001908529E|nr:DUF6221 family protein [Streptomyces adelaidensis]
MDDLVQWLRAQLDEDERIARAATRGPWVQSGIGDYGWTVDFGRPGAGVETADTEQGLADADFIAAHNPARVLREIESKRELVKLHSRATLRAGGGAQYFGTTTVCRSCEPDHQFPELSWPCPTLRLLTAPYSGRDGYREEWAP